MDLTIQRELLANSSYWVIDGFGDYDSKEIDGFYGCSVVGGFTNQSEAIECAIKHYYVETDEITARDGFSRAQSYFVICKTKKELEEMGLEIVLDTEGATDFGLDVISKGAAK